MIETLPKGSHREDTLRHLRDFPTNAKHKIYTPRNENVNHQTSELKSYETEKDNYCNVYVTCNSSGRSRERREPKRCGPCH